MAIDYKRELEKAAKSMILVLEPNTLIKMIIRLMVQKVKVVHAGVLLHDDQQNAYTLRASRGLKGQKPLQESTTMDYNNPLIRFFRERRDKQILGDGILVYQRARRFLRKRLGAEAKKDLSGALYQMKALDAVVCIPSYFRDDLLGILFLGNKSNKRKFHRKELDFFAALASDVAMAMRNARLFKQLQEELNKRQQLFMNTTVALAAAIEAKDHYTGGHTQNVIDLSLKIAGRMIEKGSIRPDGKFLEHLQIAALLHDIGKIGVPETILNKEGALTAEEREKIHQHPVIGANILHPIKELEPAIQGVKYHHERYDGKGYPEGLDNDKIPVIAAIIAVADTFDAITSQRPYREAMNRQDAIAEIKRVSGQQLHPEIVSVFLQLCEEGKI